MENTSKPSTSTFSVKITVTLIVISLLAGGLLGYLTYYYFNAGKVTNLQNQFSALKNELSDLQSQIDNLQGSTGSNLQNMTETVASFEDQLSSIEKQINDLETEANAENQSSSGFQASIANLQNQLSALQSQVSNLSSSTKPDIVYVLGENFSLSQLFDDVKDSVVEIRARKPGSTIQGSGFIYRYSGANLVLTNNHVVSGTTSITVFFANGDSYSASIRGSTPETDFAVLTFTIPQNSRQALEITTSSTLKVGDPVVAVGAPYGLGGSMTNGIVSALNRTVTTDSGTTLTNVIQSTAPLNPGNSGGPLINYNGQVVGITTAIVEESQGIGFAIPSDRILSEIQRIMSS